jgi:hypothetical protein
MYDMREGRAFRRSAAVLLIAVSATGCSPTQSSNPTSIHGASVISGSGTQYSSTSLKEVRRFSQLPKGVQTLAENSFMKESFDFTPTKFLIGGAGGSNAIVAYEQGGVVETYHAQAYVLKNSEWVADKHWRLASAVTTLEALISATSSQPDSPGRDSGHQ